MTKKVFMKPEMQAMGIQEESELLAYSVQSTGLGDNDNLKQVEGETSGDTWDDALSRRGAWDEE